MSARNLSGSFINPVMRDKSLPFVFSYFIKKERLLSGNSLLSLIKEKASEQVTGTVFVSKQHFFLSGNSLDSLSF